MILRRGSVAYRVLSWFLSASAPSTSVLYACVLYQIIKIWSRNMYGKSTRCDALYELMVYADSQCVRLGVCVQDAFNSPLDS